MDAIAMAGFLSSPLTGTALVTGAPFFCPGRCGAGARDRQPGPGNPTGPDRDEIDDFNEA
jgi:hypothetical protein